MTTKTLTTKQQTFLDHLIECNGDSDIPIPQANMRLQAAQTILDRVGLGKTDRLNLNIDSKGGGLFILPAKQETVIEAEYEEN